MKKTAFLFISLFTSIISFAQNKNWKELDEFHALAKNAFHSAEAGNVKPAREDAANIFAKAKAWQASAVPEAFDSKAIKPLLDKLVVECSNINDAVVAKKKDTVLRELVARAHSTFHEILEKANVSH